MYKTSLLGLFGFYTIAIMPFCGIFRIFQLNIYDAETFNILLFIIMQNKKIIYQNYCLGLGVFRIRDTKMFESMQNVCYD